MSFTGSWQLQQILNSVAYGAMKTISFSMSSRNPAARGPRMETSGPRDSLRSHPQGPLEGTLDVSPTVYEGILSFRGLGKFGVYTQGMWAKSLKFGRLFKSFVVGHLEIRKS